MILYRGCHLKHEGTLSIQYYTMLYETIAEADGLYMEWCIHVYSIKYVSLKE